MNNNFAAPMLVFDFYTGTNLGAGRRVFSNPVKVIEIDQVGDVEDGLRTVEEWVKRGYYAAGFISYEAAPAFDPAYHVQLGQRIPLMWFGIFEAPHRVLPGAWQPEFRFGPWHSNVSRDEYIDNIAKIKHAIASGDTYQVNYTLKLKSHFNGDDFGCYQFLQEAGQANFSAYLNLGRQRILSLSPELFFTIRDNQVMTRPMKGTSARGRWLEEDKALASQLFASEKNRAENVMIVDLLRNDLSKIPGVQRVSVPHLFDIERYSTVFQMTSTITADLQAKPTVRDVLKALFPCGSITGAPKIRTMELISELERQPRGIYCGTIGVIEPSGDATFNVAIRTAHIDASTSSASYGVGGGITWDSTADGEYDEAWTKAKLLEVPQVPYALLETMKWDDGEFILLDRHLHRLLESAEFFRIPADKSLIIDRLEAHIASYANEIRRVRLLISQTGDIHVESQALQPDLGSKKTFALATTSISKKDVFLYHKTTNRDVYKRHQQQHPDVFDVLLWNEEKDITEFTNGNIVLEIQGEKVTPARDCGLLGGTFRAELLATGTILERRIAVSELKMATRVWFINSVRGWVDIEQVDR